MSTDPHAPQDPDGKADAAAFQPDFLAEVGEAVAAGLEAQDEDPTEIDPADHDDLWAGRVGL